MKVINSNAAALAKLAERAGERLASVGADTSDPLTRIHRDAVSQFSGHVRKLASRMSTLQAMADTRSPTVTEAMHLKKVAKAATELAEDATSRNAHVNTTMQAAMQQVQAAFDSKVDLRQNEYGAEIRAQFRQLKPEARHTLIKEFIETNRGPEIAALLKAPEYLTGLSRQQQTDYIESMYYKHAPAELALRDEILNDFDDAMTALRVAKNAAEGFIDHQRLAEIERDEAKAQAAVEAFERAR